MAGGRSLDFGTAMKQRQGTGVFAEFGEAEWEALHAELDLDMEEAHRADGPGTAPRASPAEVCLQKCSFSSLHDAMQLDSAWRCRWQIFELCSDTRGI